LLRSSIKALVLLLAMSSSLSAQPIGHAPVHSVGILTLLGDEVTLQRTALLFGGIDEKVPVATAAFDATAEKAIIDCARIQNPSMTFKTINLPKRPLIDKLRTSVLYNYNATMALIRPDILEWVKRNPVDAIVVVREVFTQVPGGPSLYFGGVGVHQFVANPAIVQATFGLVIIDGRTFDDITEGYASPIAGTYPGTVDQLRDELKAGHHLPIEDVLRRLVQAGTCKMISNAKL